MNGNDRQTVGAEAWRNYIAAAPQFHENHVLAETFAFNLFLGRRGIIGPPDLTEAEEICAELGLAELLNACPPAFYKWSEKPDGSFRTANEAASTLLALCYKIPSW